MCLRTLHTSWETDENKASAVPFAYDWPLFLTGAAFCFCSNDAVIFILIYERLDFDSSHARSILNADHPIFFYFFLFRT